MNDFGPTDERLRRVEARMPGFPFEPMRLLRMTYHLQKTFRDMSNAALRKYELTDTSYTVLAILYGSPGEASSASDLGAACGEKPANLTRVTDELVARGLVERGPKPGDRRAVMLSLSEAGRRLIERALPEVSEKMTVAYAGFSPDELRQLAAFQARLIANLGRLEP